jgi:hypothetical protein
MRLIKKPISLFIVLTPFFIHAGILGKYYIESVEIDDKKTNGFNHKRKVGWLAMLGIQFQLTGVK